MIGGVIQRAFGGYDIVSDAVHCVSAANEAVLVRLCVVVLVPRVLLGNETYSIGSKDGRE